MKNYFLLSIFIWVAAITASCFLITGCGGKEIKENNADKKADSGKDDAGKEDAGEEEGSGGEVVCESQERKCEGARLEICNAKGFWVLERDCSLEGLLCEDGKCLPEEEEEQEAEWSEVKINSINAPDERSVVAHFDRDPGSERAEKLEAYKIDSELGELDIEEIQYSPEERVLTITTGPQKLGVEYNLSIANGDDIGPSAAFLSADSRVFWAADFAVSFYTDMEVKAYRAAVGKSSVLYIQEGYKVENLQNLLSEFDDKIYPTLTNLFIPAPDIDENGKIVILALDGGEHFGGYFSPVNQYPDEETSVKWGLRSNEMEMIYLSALTPDYYQGYVLAHEFQHLLYHDYRGYSYQYWEYHDEGLAECAIKAVYPDYDLAEMYYQWDPDNLIRNGLSLARWNYAEYSNYSLAYIFWNYVAGQMTADASSYGAIFSILRGSPSEVNDFLIEEIGMDMPTAYQSMLAAYWLQNEEGRYSFNGMISPLEPGSSPTVSTGTSSLNLDSFAGAVFRLRETSVDYPGTQGTDIRYWGINGAGEIDYEAPFDVEGGALIVANTSVDYSGWPTQTSGPDLAALRPSLCGKKRLERNSPRRFPTWSNPPPYNPYRAEIWLSWRAKRDWLIER